MAFGVIEGVVPAGFRKPGVFVSLPGRDGRRATCDGNGRFVLEDVPAGTYGLRPPGVRVPGTVTVGGKGLDGRANEFLIVAEYQGKGKVDHLLSQTLAPEADGGFDLAGLTPGTYRVQASMDGIWLSQSVRLTVGPAAGERGPLTLDIGAPGRASVLRLRSRQGQPVRGVTATVARPDGPLAEALWPARFAADGAGVVRLPPLEAGTHRVRIPRADGEKTLTIPPLTGPRDEPVELRVEVD